MYHEAHNCRIFRIDNCGAACHVRVSESPLHQVGGTVEDDRSPRRLGRVIPVVIVVVVVAVMVEVIFAVAVDDQFLNGPIRHL